MSDKIRVTIECCKCNREFEITLLKESLKSGKIVECPFCEERCKIELNEREESEVFRGIKVYKN